jgi:DNA-binding PadR family transcriptional regulator
MQQQTFHTGRRSHRSPSRIHAAVWRLHHREDRPRGRGGFGPGFGRAFAFGFGPGGFGGWQGRRGARRGDVRTAILTLLAEAPMHGYQIMQQLAERSGGLWQPSAGSIYPTLQQLEDEGLVTGTEQDGRRVYSLTEAGRAAAAESAKRGQAPWQVDGADEAADLRSTFISFATAFWQVTTTGSPETVAAASEILTDARRRLYRLLADEEAESGPAPTGGMNAGS